MHACITRVCICVTHIHRLNKNRLDCYANCGHNVNEIIMGASINMTGLDED